MEAVAAPGDAATLSRPGAAGPGRRGLRRHRGPGARGRPRAPRRAARRPCSCSAGFVNGFFPSRDYFDATVMTPDKQKLARATDIRRLYAAAGKPTERLVASWFTSIRPGGGRDSSKLEIGRVRLRRGERIATTSLEHLLEGDRPCGRAERSRVPRRPTSFGRRRSGDLLLSHSEKATRPPRSLPSRTPRVGTAALAAHAGPGFHSPAGAGTRQKSPTGAGTRQKLPPRPTLIKKAPARGGSRCKGSGEREPPPTGAFQCLCTPCSRIRRLIVAFFLTE